MVNTPNASGGHLAPAAGGGQGLPADAQLRAALAARRRLEELLSAPTPFASDDGAADPAVTAALEVQGLARHEYLDRLLAALAASRLIVPVAAHAVGGPKPLKLGESAPGILAHEPHTADAAEDAAELAVRLDDGHLALPVFTSAAAVAAWRDDVRPVPVTPQRAAQVACRSTDQLWVLDPGTRDLRLPRPAVVALAGGEDWIPSWRNEPVQAEVAAQLGAVDGVTGVAFAPGEGAELRVFIRVDASAGNRAVAAALEQCQYVMVNPAWGEFIDTVELCPVPA
ncbi:SseB protein N-terminal domain-containing protein [Actinomyces ruminicola]|uniref:SseB protein N-terminal domain-containing protein n=1 Tax=Actinomyces ruminicola TaxID=332524 RepID=A0A1G9TKH7_9ACTO|nr:SseB protein N-terminal domain-containing protein [Actinomyces ruminicola]